MAFKAAPSTQHEHCTDEAQKSETVLSAGIIYTPISKNVVGEYGEWQLSNGNCTTERNCGFHINEFFAWR